MSALIYLKPNVPSRFYSEIPNEDVADSRDLFPVEFQSIELVSQKLEAFPRWLQELLKQILGKMAKVRPGVSTGEDFQSLQEAYEEMYYGR